MIIPILCINHTRNAQLNMYITLQSITKQAGNFLKQFPPPKTRYILR